MTGGSSATSTSPLLSPGHQRAHLKHLPQSPTLPIKPTGIWRQILTLAVPNVVSSLAMYSTVVITTLCISHEDRPDLLAAFGLGNLIANVLGLSIGVGLTSVLETLVSQAYGAGSVYLTAVHLNRARLVVTVAVIPCSIALYYTDWFLLALGQDPAVAELAVGFTRGSIFGLLPFFLFCCSSSYLRSCQRPQPPLMANVIGSIVHLFVSVYFVNILQWELWGAGLSLSVNNIVRLLIIEGYIAKNPSLKGHLWTPEMMSLRGIKHFLGLGIPSLLLVAIEWSAFELQAVFAGWVSTDGLAAHVAGINVIAIVFMVPNGVSQSLSTLIGASLGEGLPEIAMKFARRGAGLMLGISSLHAIVILLYVDAISRLYSTEPQMLDILQTILRMTCMFVVFDALNTTEAGIIRGLGLQTKAAKYQAVAMFGVMLPIGYVAYPYWGVPGVWVGSIVGMIVSASLFFSIIKRADLIECSRRAIAETRHGSTMIQGDNINV